MNIPTLHENILESLGEGVIGTDLNLTITLYNQLAEKTTGVSRSQTIGRHMREVIKDLWLITMAENTLNEGKTFVEYENSLHQKGGGLLPVGVTASPIQDPGGNTMGVVILIRDLSGVKTLEEESIRRDRLALISTFTASIAHEVKNPLGGIRGATQLLAKRIKDTKLLEYTEVVIKEVDRLNRFLENAIRFTSPGRLNPEPLNIHEVLDAVLLLQGEVAMGKDIILIKEYDPSLPSILGDRGQLTQVFLNLIKNGVEATDRNGEVRVITKMVTDFYRVGPAPQEGYKGGRMVEVEVKDNGCGIPQEDLTRVFTPFFTTKAKGSGLGLSISYRIVKDHGGFFKIESREGAGTMVSVFLPIAE
ncbi:MAG: PAS domain S-box protein [Deltaproteobacteria bacterium]|nr:PAS domain S-box protein [Deltaproteobacteria bacterium]